MKAMIRAVVASTVLAGAMTCIAAVNSRSYVQGGLVAQYGWDYYSEKCLEYLVGSRRQGVIKAYRFLYVLFVAIGPYLTVSVVWGVADAMNGLMAFPNLVALILLSPVVWKVTRDFLGRKVSGGTGER